MRRTLIWALVILSSGACFAQGGPPLMTDDPDTPGNGKWEVNVLAEMDRSHDIQEYQFPHLDINYGLGDKLQLKFETGLVTQRGEDFKTRSGIGKGMAGVKWRFLDEEASGVSLSTYPQFEFHHFLTTSDTHLIEMENRLLLPLEASKRFGLFTVVAEIGYEFHFTDEEGANEEIFGIATAYELQKEFEVMMEVHGTNRPKDNDGELLFNVGTHYGLSETASLLLSAGHTLKTFQEDGPRFLMTAGVQLVF